MIIKHLREIMMG